MPPLIGLLLIVVFAPALIYVMAPYIMKAARQVKRRIAQYKAGRQTVADLLGQSALPWAGMKFRDIDTATIAPVMAALTARGYTKWSQLIGISRQQLIGYGFQHKDFHCLYRALAWFFNRHDVSADYIDREFSVQTLLDRVKRVEND